ncbi:hypothetical protein [Tenacibaculum sp. Bg11-29]|uniref:hypothetical protein n=1 Tax=Tenacibaculum sp. Bg11-29 TaxID=2058306 RepID=UPI0012FEC0C0|nr:hypothetical protein [Tenacibaculum sp. Bg11-29]
MRIVLIFFYITTMLSCKNEQTYYHGIIFNEKQIPLSRVIITDGVQSTFSNNNGYFKLYRNPNFLSELTFSKEGFETRIMKTVGTQHGESIRYKFLNMKADTLHLKKITLPN